MDRAGEGQQAPTLARVTLTRRDRHGPTEACLRQGPLGVGHLAAPAPVFSTSKNRLLSGSNSGGGVIALPVAAR